jgi:hypothetical protein
MCIIVCYKNMFCGRGGEIMGGLNGVLILRPNF